MWVECTVKVRARHGEMSGEAIMAGLATDMSQLKKSRTPTLVEVARKRYDNSEHFHFHQRQSTYRESVLAAEDSSGVKVFWLSGLTDRTEAKLIKVVEGSPVQAHAFALAVYTDLEAAIPSAFSIVHNEIRIENVSHRFRVVSPGVPLPPIPELFVLLLVTVAWTILSRAWTQGSWIETFMNGVLVNAAFAIIIVLAHWGYNVVKARKQRRIEYFYG